MQNTQQMLEAAIQLYGIGDIRTLELSRERDKEVAKEQREIYERYKKCMG